MAIGDILAGLAEASHAHETNLLTLAHQDRMEKAKLFAELATNPNYTPEQQAWFGKAALAHASGDKEAKQYDIKNGQIQVPVEIMQSKPAPIDIPGSPGQSGADEQGQPRQAVAPILPRSIQPPTPPPRTEMRDVFQPMSPTETTNIAASRAGAIAAAQAPAKPPQMDVGTFGPDSSGLYNKTTGEVIQPPTPPKSNYELKVGTIDGKPVVVNYDPKIGKSYMNGVDVTAQFKPKEAEKSVDERAADAWLAKHPNATVDDYIAWKSSLGQAGAEARSEENRLQSSYQFHSSQLSALEKPVDEAVARLGRLQDTIGQGNMQADALIAPELLTVMAGGQGSGLRMNEAEIARIVGGRTQWETLKAQIQKWSLNPDAARSITAAQDAQIRKLVGAVGEKLRAKQDVFAGVQQTVASAQDVNQHKQALVNLRQSLNAIDNGKFPIIDPRGKIHLFDTKAQADAFSNLISGAQ